MKMLCIQITLCPPSLGSSAIENGIDNTDSLLANSILDLRLLNSSRALILSGLSTGSLATASIASACILSLPNNRSHMVAAAVVEIYFTGFAAEGIGGCYFAKEASSDSNRPLANSS
jgi:hypothetical protein